LFFNCKKKNRIFFRIFTNSQSTWDVSITDDPEAFIQQVAWPGVQLPIVREGDTFGVADDDAANVEADNDYVADISDAHRAWDPGPTQD